MECWIKRIGVRGEGKNLSDIRFEPGLNIVVGPSNTGKTMIFELVDYVFGSDAILRSVLQEYQVAFAEIETSEGVITLERPIGEGATKVTIRSEWAGIENNEYNVDPRTTYDNSLNAVLLKLCGIDSEIRVAKNAKWKTQRLTWRTIKHLFMVDESLISAKSPILDTRQATARTGMLSAFLYFAQGTNFADEFLLYDPDFEKSRRLFHKTLLEQKQNEYSSLQETLGCEVEEQALNQVEDLNVDLYELEERINKTIADIDVLRVKAQDLKRIIAEEDSVLLQLVELEKQYESDLTRLNFVAEGFVEATVDVREYECPICESRVVASGHQRVFTSAVREYRRIANALDGLRETIDAEKVNQAEQQKILDEYDQEVASLEQTICNELEPQRTILIATISAMKKQFELASKLELLDQLQMNTAKELTQLTREDTTYKEYKPNARFTEETLECIRGSIQGSLSLANYPKTSNVIFDLATRDVVIEGMAKRDFGQGYRAYLNTIVSLSLYNTLMKIGCYRPWLLAYDSPINVLKQPKENVDRPMKEGLFNLMAQIGDNVQIIAFENDDLGDGFPEAANIIRFSKRNDEGRYGFLIGYKDES